MKIISSIRQRRQRRTTVMPRTTMIVIVVFSLFALSASREIGDPVRRMTDDSGAKDAAPAYRLPRDTQPVAYGLRLVPNYDKGSGTYTFGGQVEILITVNSITPNITLNAKDIQIKSVAITEFKTQTDLVVDGFEMTAEYERLTIYAAKNLLAGRRYQVKIVFQGYLRTDMTGFYKSTYRENDVTKWMAVSNFKPTYARRAFPCYDEPEYKTPFNVSLGRQGYQMTLSNMPCYMTQRLEYYGFWADHFETTPPIPTYLVGIMVGEFKNANKMNDSNVNVYTYEEYLNQTAYVLENTPMVFEVMENYTQNPSQVKKMDFLAMPDFDANGAENWGINFYREKYMLLDVESKAKFKEQSTMVIQQQQSHQWFGNLVTCSWWDFLWLNEGFARYFQYFATDTIKPDWRMEALFVVEQHQTAMEYDQTPRHPVTASVKTSGDIQSIFDRVTYNKAAAILRMLMYTVSETNFHEPLKLYLANYKYGATNPSLLWAVFENYYFDIGFQLRENVPFTDFVLSWTDQSSYPVINVTRNDNTYIVTQQTFSIFPSSDSTTRWYIGLTYTNNLATNFEDLSPVKWVKPSSTATYIRDSRNLTWSIFNLQSTGFYRVNYDKENWEQLILQLKNSHDVIHVLNRAQLIDDSFNLARAGMLNYSTALNLSTYLQNEDDDIPWYTAINCFTYVIERMRRSAEGYDYIKSYVRNLAESVYKKTEALVLYNNTEHHRTATSWNTFSVWACSLDSEYCTRSALNNFKKWSMGQNISPDIKDAALCTGIKVSNDTDTWRGVLGVYTSTKSASEKNSAQTALTCTQDILILYKYLDFLFDSGHNGPVRLQDFKDICDAMSLTPQGIESLTNFLINNIERILKTVPTGESIVTYMYRILASKVALDSEIIKLYRLKNAVGLPPNIKASFDESYVQVEQNIHWYNSYHIDINQWTGAPMEVVTTPEPTLPEPTSLATTPESTSPATTPELTSLATTLEPTSPATTPEPTSPATTWSPTTLTSTTPATKPEPTSPATKTTETTSPATNNTETTSPATIPTEPISPATNTTETTSPSTTSPSTTLEGGNGTTHEKFDFDHTPPPVISRCPNKSGSSIYRSGPTAIIFVAVYVFTNTIVYYCSKK